MPDEFDELCSRRDHRPPPPAAPHVAPIHLSSVYECSDPRQARELLSGEADGYVYRRDRHPNADQLAEKCRKLHGAERAAICGSGMAAMALAVVSQLCSGEHLIASDGLYGRSLSLLVDETARLGIESTVVDTCDLAAVETAIRPSTRLVVVETISNPLVRVADVAALANLAHRRGCRLLVDNTFAGPVVFRPIAAGADLILESLTKTMNGHSDVVLGLLCGSAECWQRVPVALSTWGLASPAFDCWLVERSLGTLELRIGRACETALAAARLLEGHAAIEAVHYPGLARHVEHDLARRQFDDRFGTIVTANFAGGEDAVARFISASEIPFCPSLGELGTTLSHPASTSHRSLTPEARHKLGIFDGTIRFSIGIESTDSVLARIKKGADAVRATSGVP